MKQMKPREPVVEVMDDQLANIYRRMTPMERLDIAMQMNQSARDLIREELVQQHPNWNEETIRRNIALRFYLNDVDEDCINREWREKLIREDNKAS